MTDERWDKFMDKVTPEPNSGCWLWLGSVDFSDYGMFWVGAGKTTRAHRLAYEHLVGPIPEGLQLDHLCRTPCCVNPKHLEPVTGRVNTLRGTSFSAKNARKTHCLRGHELNGENLYRTSKGRECRACRSENATKMWTARLRRLREAKERRFGVLPGGPAKESEG